LELASVSDCLVSFLLFFQVKFSLDEMGFQTVMALDIILVSTQ